MRYIAEPSMRAATHLSSEEVMFLIVCKEGLNSCVAPFLAAGVDPLCKIDGESPALLLAASDGNTPLVDQLLQHGVPIHGGRSYPTTNA